MGNFVLGLDWRASLGKVRTNFGKLIMILSKTKASLKMLVNELKEKKKVRI